MRLEGAQERPHSSSLRSDTRARFADNDGVFAGLRIPSSDEEVGLDISEHGETAYHELEVQQISQETAARMPSHFGVTATMKRRVSQYQRIEQERDEGSCDVALIGDIQ